MYMYMYIYIYDVLCIYICRVHPRRVGQPRGEGSLWNLCDLPETELITNVNKIELILNVNTPIPNANSHFPFLLQWQAELMLACTRYRHYQYCMACIAIKDCRGETLYCAIVRAMKGGGGAQTRGVFANDSIDSYTKV